MGSIGPNPSFGTYPGSVLTLLLLLILIIEFKAVRSTVIFAVFAITIIYTSSELKLLWRSALSPLRSLLFPVLLYVIHIAGLLGLTWLLWRRESVFLYGLSVLGWWILAGLTLYSVYSIQATLQGFFHWVQIVEFVGIALCINFIPCYMVYFFWHRGYPFSDNVNTWKRKQIHSPTRHGKE